MASSAEHTLESQVVPVEAPVETQIVDAPLETTEAAPSTIVPQTEDLTAPTSTLVPAPTADESVAAAEAPEVAAAPETAVEEPVKAIESGVLGYKAPGLIKSFKFSKKHFWLGDEPVSHDKLSTYLRGEKPEIAHSTAAWSHQTGKGLLYFAKHVEEKSHPAGVLNLAEASDVEKQSPHEFSFKLHGHKHTFKAADDAERDGWYIAIEKAITEAKASKDSVVTSEGYKESLTHLAKPAVFAGAATPAATSARKSTNAPKIEEPERAGSSSSSSDEEAAAKKTKTQSRSVSRNKRSSIFGNFLAKKEDHDVKKEIKKEEKEEAKEVKKEEEVAKAEEALTGEAPVEAPLDAEAVAARAVDAPVEEETVVPVVATEPTPVTDVAKEEVRPKPSKRSSIFGSFFEKVRSPAHEKKEPEFAPIVPPKDSIVSAEPPVIPEPSTTETTIESPAAAVVTGEQAVPTVEEPVVTKNEAVSPTKEKGGFFGGMMSKVRAKSPANVNRSAIKSEDAPAVPPKAEGAEVVEPAGVAPVSTETVPAAEEPFSETSNKAVTPKENRRKSYFGGSNKISSIFRKPSQAVRNTESSKKENVSPTAEDKAVATETPAVNEEAVVSEAPVTEAVAPEAEASNEATSEALPVGHEHKDASVVSAAA